MAQIPRRESEQFEAFAVISLAIGFIPAGVEVVARKAIEPVLRVIVLSEAFRAYVRFAALPHLLPVGPSAWFGVFGPASRTFALLPDAL